MPHFYESSSSASDTTPEFDPQNAYQRVVSDDEYIASSSAELPLSQQLEPIAVVGMGKICPSYLARSPSVDVDENRMSSSRRCQLAIRLLEVDDGKEKRSNA